MTETAHPPQEFSVVAHPHQADERTHVLKHDDTFAVMDRFGDIHQIGGLGQQGLYHDGTRFLSHLVWRCQSMERLLYLSSAIKEDNLLLTVDLTNPDVGSNGTIVMPRGVLHLRRAKFLWRGACYEQCQLRNFSERTLRVIVCVEFAADFADIFEVRGMKRRRRGRVQPARALARGAAITYVGLDQVIRRTRLEGVPRPHTIQPNRLEWRITLPPGGEHTVTVRIRCESGRVRPHRGGFAHAHRQATARLLAAERDYVAVTTSHQAFNAWWRRSANDVAMMATATAHGPYPYAGVPWYNTVFGRDGLLTARECLWINPQLARGVLGLLAATQARRRAAAHDAEPGKIVHEMRRGEMAALGEVPFGRYYGSVDATPLFVWLASDYYRRTADRPFLEALWPAIVRALAWIERYGDRDQDGFVEYARCDETGLINQGWKDSQDAVMHADGTLARPPIAMCEVQGYVYAAWRGAAYLARALGHERAARRHDRAADALQARFAERFWLPSLGTYGLALDAAKNICAVRTSNAGQCLLTGIATAEHAAVLADTLFDPAMFSGWGIRTLAASERRYNPMSYHNGSVWPHDNALIAAGLARYGHTALTQRLVSGLLDASQHCELARLPELFCGFSRRAGEAPTQYPVACAPQAWAAGAVFLMIEACLGLMIDAVARTLRFEQPVLPATVHSMQIRGLTVGSATVDLWLQRQGEDVAVTVTRKQGPLHVEVIK